MTEQELQEQFDAVFEDLYCELAKFGHLLELHVSLLSVLSIKEAFSLFWAYRQVCDNVGDHLIGNVYARYEWEAEAQAAVDNLNDRWYAGKFLIDASVTTRRCSFGSPATRFISVCRPTVVRRVVSRHGLS